MIDIGWIQKGMSDIEQTWEISLAVAGIAFVASIVLLLLIRLLAGCIVWSIIILYFIILIVLGIFCISKAQGDMSDLPKQLQSKELLQIIGGICLGVAGISLLVFFCIFNKIRRAVAIMKAASDFVREQCLIILLPIVKFIIICGFLAFWVVVSLYIYSSGTVKANPDSPFG